MTRQPRKFSATRLLVVVGLMVLVGVGLLLARRLGESYVQAWIEESASERIGATVVLGEIELDLLPLALRASQVEVRSNEDSALLASAAEVEVAAGWRDLRGAPRRLRSISVRQPRLVVVRDEDGSLNWPSFSAGKGGAGLAIDQLLVSEAAVEFADRRVEFDLDMQQLGARASGSTKSQFAGGLDAAEVTVGLSTGATYVGAVGVRGAWENGRLRVVSGQVSGPELKATLGAGEFDLADKSWSIELEAEGQASVFHRLGVGDRSLSGTWRFDGALSGDEAWRLAGSVAANNLGLDDLIIARLDADLSADPERVVVAGIEGRFAQGVVRADVDVAWAEASRPIRVDAQLANGSLPALLAQFDIELPELAGSWDGRGHYVFGADAPFNGSGSADFSLRAQDRAGTLAWRRDIPVDIKNGVASFRTLTTDTERERISASGSYDLPARQAEVTYRVDTEHVEAWLRLMGLGQDEGSTDWLPSAGRGSIEGSLNAVPGDWWSRLSLDLQDVAVGAFSPADVQGPLTVSAEGVRDLRLTMTQFDAAMLVAGAVDAPPGESPLFRLNVEASGWAVEEVLTQLGLPPSVTGPLEGSARIDGAADDLRMSSSLEVMPAVILGQPADRVAAELDLAEGVLAVRRAAVDAPAGSLSMSGSLPVAEGDLALTLSLDATDLAASPVAGLLPAGSTGQLSGHGTITGTLQSPVLFAELESTSLELAGYDFAGSGGTKLTSRLADGQLEIDGTLGEVLTLAGGGTLSAEEADLELAIASDRVDALLALAAPQLAQTIEGRLAGAIGLSGSLGQGVPAPELRLDELVLRYDGRELQALEPVQASWRANGLDVDSFFLGDEASQSELFLFGRLPLADDEALDLRGQVSLDTEWFEPLLPGWELAGGRFEALASVGGTLAKPAISGQGEVVQSRLDSPGLAQPLRDLEGVLLFYPDQIVVDDGAAGFAGGTLRMAGSVEPFASPQFGYRFQVAAADVQLRYPEGWQVRGDAELVIASEDTGQLVRGQVSVDRALYTSDVPIGLTQLLQTAFSRRVELVEETDEFLTSTRLNIAVQGDSALEVKNNIASLRGDVDFVIRGTLARPVIFGTVDVEPGGTLLYAGNSYDVQRASLEFVNPYRIEPVIDLVAATHLAQYDVTLDLAGTLDRLEVNFASNPPLADLQVLSLLAGGEAPRSASLDGTTGDSTGLAESFLYQQAASVVAARVNRLFGLDKFRIDPLTGDTGDISSARVTVGKRLGRDLFATYSYDPSETGQQILELEWRVSRELTVVATQNGDESYAVDLRWDRSF